MARQTDRQTESGLQRVPYRPPQEDSGERDIQTDRERERERVAYSAYHTDHRTRIVARETDRRIVDSGERDRETERVAYSAHHTDHRTMRLAVSLTSVTTNSVAQHGVTRAGPSLPPD